MMHGKSFRKTAQDAAEKSGPSRRAFLVSAAAAPIAAPAMAKAAITGTKAIPPAALRIATSGIYGYLFKFFDRAEWLSWLRTPAQLLEARVLNGAERSSTFFDGAVVIDRRYKQLEDISAVLSIINTQKNDFNVELSDLTDDCLSALQAANPNGMFFSIDKQQMLENLRLLRESGCRDWNDMTALLLKKAIPLIDLLDQANVPLPSNAPHTIHSLGIACKETLGPDFAYVEAQAKRLGAKLETLDEAYDKKAKRAASHQKKIDQPTAEKVEATGSDYFVSALPPRRNSNESFFHIVPAATATIQGFDVDRLLRKLRAPNGKTGSFTRHASDGKPGLTISTNDAALIHFLNGCTRGNLAFPARPRPKSAALAAPKA